MRREWCLICTEKIYMNCNRCQILLEQLLDGQLDAAMEAEVLAHVECCVSCAHWRRDLQRVWELLDAEKSLEPSPGFVVRTIRRAVTVNESPTLLLPRRIFWPVPRRLWAMASAGAMVLVVLSGYWLLRQTAGPPEIVTGEQPELFTQLPIVANLDLLQDLDVIEQLDAIAESGASQTDAL